MDLSDSRTGSGLVDRMVGLATPAEPVTEWVTVLFCDMVGSTELLTRRGLAVSERVRQRLFRGLRDAVVAAGGHEVKGTGDGLMVVFSELVDDAVACAVVMQRSVAAMRREFEDDGIRLKVGIAAGAATLAIEERDWFGAPVNLAAHLCAAAAADQVLIDDTAAAACIGSGPPSATLHSVVLKGGVSTDARSIDWAPPAVLSPMPLPPALSMTPPWPIVGRATEQAILERAWRRSVGGSPGVVVLVGDPGVGTSALARDLAERVHGEGAIVLHAVADPDGPVLGELVVATSPLEHLVGADPASSAAREEWMLDAAASLAPTLLLIDDVHHLGEAAIGFVSHLVDGPRRLLVVACGHSNPFPPVIAEEVTVGRLARAAVEDLLSRVAGPQPSLMIDEVCDAADGNVRDVLDVATRLRFGRRSVAGWAASPYRGLSSLTAGDQNLLFGRAGFVTDVIGTLERHPVVAVVGRSGVGKSSVLHAGVVPAFTTPAATAAPWSVVSFRPGTDPWRSLARALAEQFDASSFDADTADALRSGALVLDQVGEGSATRLLVVIDQFEEILRHTEPAMAAAFVAALIEGATRSSGRVRVLVAARSDFYDQLIELPGMASVLQDAQLVLAPMDDRQLRDVILGPARLAALDVDDDLVRMMLDDVRGRAGGLPLLAHALFETWRRRHGRRLTVAAYRETGGVPSAVAFTAERLHEGLDAADRDRLRSLLLRMVVPGLGTGDVRRAVPFDELPDELRRLAPKLIDARLVTADGEVIEVAHEALFGGWPRLQDWLVVEQEGIQIHARLRLAVRAWLDDARDPHGLYAGSRLATVERWMLDRCPALNDDERAFLVASRARAAERDRRRRILTGAIVSTAVLALIAGGAALVQHRAAAHSNSIAAARASEAADERQRAEIRGLVAEATVLADSQPDLALLLATEAARIDSSDATASGVAAVLGVQPALQRYAPPDPRLVDLTGVLAVGGDSLVVWSPSAEGFVVVDVETMRPTGVTVRAPTTGRAAVTPGGTQMLTADAGGTFRRWDLRTGAEVPLAAAEAVAAPEPARRPAAIPSTLALLPDGTAVTTVPGALLLLPPGASAPVVATDHLGARLLAASPTGRWLALAEVTTGTSGLRVVERTDMRSRGVRIAYPLAATFLDDDRLMVSSFDETGTSLTVVDVGSSTVLAGPVPLASSPFALVPATDGTVDVIGVDGNVMRVTADLHVTSRLRLAPSGSAAVPIDDRRMIGLVHGNLVMLDRTGRSGSVHDLVAGDEVPHGSLGSSAGPGAVVALASPSVASVFRLGEIGSPATRVSAGSSAEIRLGRFFGAVTDDGALVALAEGGEARVVDSRTGQVLFTIPNTTVSGFAFSTDGKSLALAGQRTVWVVDATTGVPRWSRGSDVVDDVIDVRWSPDDAFVSVHSLGTGDTSILDGATGAVVRHVGPTNGVVFSPDGRSVAVLNGDMVVQDVRTGDAAGPRLGASLALAAWYSPDGELIAVLTYGGRLAIFDSGTGERLGLLTDVSRVTDRISPLSVVLARRSGGVPGSGHGFAGLALYAGDGEGPITEIDLGAEAWAATACRIAGRNLTRDEWDRYLPFAGPYRATCPEYPAPT